VLSHPEGDVFARMGSNPSRATVRIAIGKVNTPVNNPRRNLAIALLLHHLNFDSPVRLSRKLGSFLGDVSVNSSGLGIEQTVHFGAEANRQRLR
jgi:hypothetical protein